MREPVKGRTDAGRRREARARTTRDRIVAAATTLFLERGYASTTVEAVAAAAAVAPATVYQAFGTKAAILARALDQAIAGDADAVPLLDRDWVATARGERDAGRRLAVVVENVATVAARSAALKEVMRDAASTEPVIRELVDEDESRRLRTHRHLLEIVLDRPPSDGELATLYSLANSRAYLLASRQLGWSEARWSRWLVDVLRHQLLRAGG